MQPLIAWLFAQAACSHEQRLKDDGQTEADSSPSTPTEIPPNILVILLDDVGIDKIAAYHEHLLPPRTPNITKLASKGMLFRNAWAYNSCSPTRAAALTGRYGRRTGVGRVVNAWKAENYRLPNREITIAELLDDAPVPWSTSLVGKWHLATFLSPSYADQPGWQGFDWYASSISNLSQTSDDSKGSYFRWERDLNGELSWQDQYCTSVQVDDAIGRVALMPEPWFLWLAFNAPHKPYSIPPEALQRKPVSEGSRVPDIYAASLEAVDAELGRLFEAIDLDRTMVILLGDNGTPSQAVLPPNRRGKDKDTMYEGGLNVPFLVAGPLVAEPGSESEALVHVVDLFPTVADIAGIDLEALTSSGELATVDGLSLVPLFEDASAPLREFVYAEEFSPLGRGPYDRDQRAVRGERYKYLINAVSDNEQLFDLQGRTDDGPDLLSEGQTLEPEAESALVQLRSALAAFDRTFQDP